MRLVVLWAELFPIVERRVTSEVRRGTTERNIAPTGSE